MSSPLLFPALLVLRDTGLLDRWRWLVRRLPPAKGGERFLDVGCGTGALAIGAALHGYDSLGLTLSPRERETAAARAAKCGARAAAFETFDARRLDARKDLRGRFDVVACCECIEHILDDKKLFRDMIHCLKPGGRLLLTTPNCHNRAISPSDEGPFSPEEDGGHVRRGYTAPMLKAFCADAGARCEEISYCSGFLSQKITWIWRHVSKLNLALAAVAILPLRVLQCVFDDAITALILWPRYSICLKASRPPG